MTANVKYFDRLIRWSPVLKNMLSLQEWMSEPNINILPDHVPVWAIRVICSFINQYEKTDTTSFAKESPTSYVPQEFLCASKSKNTFTPQQSLECLVAPVIDQNFTHLLEEQECFFGAIVAREFPTHTYKTWYDGHDYYVEGGSLNDNGFARLEIIMEVCEFLGVDLVLEKTAQYIADMISQVPTVEQLRKLFGIAPDGGFSPDELQEMEKHFSFFLNEMNKT